MNPLPAHSSVVIVGAGPSGLMMASQLLRHGIHPIIVDQKTSPTTESRAIAVQARTLEIFRQMDLHETALKEGNIVKGLRLHQGTDELAHVDLSTAGSSKSHFPYVLILEQSKIERILLDYLTANACPVYWDTPLLDLHQTDKVISARVRRKDVEEIISCDWIIGADGVSSKVRNELNIGFVGGTYSPQFYLADFKIKGGLSNDAVRIFLKEDGFAAIFPMADSNYRFVGMVPTSLTDKTEVSFNDLKPYLTYTMDVPMTEECCTWFSVYKVHHRMAEKFSSRRGFLIGDAAHVHSPVGGQGMNTGLQDAYNLAWKLAGVIAGKYSRSVLDTYSKERIPIAQSLLKSTDRMFAFSFKQGWFIRKLRTWLMPFVVSRFWKSFFVGNRIFGWLSQLEIQYRTSALSVHHSQAKNIKAGDRLPYIKFFDEKLKEETDLHVWCSSVNFTLIVVGDLSQRDLLAVAKWIKLTYPGNLNFFYLPYSKRNQHVFDCFEIKESGKKALMVRPDMHIGYINDIVDIEILEGYLQESLGWGANI